MAAGVKNKNLPKGCPQFFYMENKPLRQKMSSG
jgi:hypothetical protein